MPKMALKSRMYKIIKFAPNSCSPNLIIQSRYTLSASCDPLVGVLTTKSQSSGLGSHSTCMSKVCETKECVNLGSIRIWASWPKIDSILIITYGAA